MTAHHASVTETLPDGRVLVTTYVRVAGRVYVRMNAYDDAGNEQNYLDVDMRVHVDGGGAGRC